MKNEQFKEKLKIIPKLPGCYQMKNINNEIIYVGKAKNLFNRVNSYFIGSHDAKTTKLVSLICDFEYIITSSEKEAFILEINLIKKYNPKYNIMLTDDKTYPYISITNEKNPRLIYTRDINNNAKHYGPYPNVKAARDIASMLNRLYPLRKCNKLPKKECVYYHLGQCLGPCINKIDSNRYVDYIKKIDNILKGKAKEEIKNIKALMEEASNNLNFERAIEYRNLLNDLNIICERQKMEGFGQDIDVFGYHINNNYISIQVFHLREGKLLERNGYLYDLDMYAFDDAQNIYEKFIVDFYVMNNQPLPNNILIKDFTNEKIAKENIEELINHRIEIPKQGKKYEIVNLVCENAKEKIDVLIRKSELEYKRTYGAINELKELLNIDSLSRIEAIDNSNISGDSAVSAIITFIDGKPDKKSYRKYKIKTVVGANDVATMYEVTLRRYKDMKNNPDLLIVDGGSAQVSSVKNALKELNRNINVLGLIKDDFHHTDSLLYDNRIIKLEKNTFLFRLLEQIQDEVHRFAISYFRTTHEKKTFSSKLDNIKGIGPVKKKAILLTLSGDNIEEGLRKIKLNNEQIIEVMRLLNVGLKER